MEKEVTLTGKEQKRLLALNEVLAGRMTGQDAADMLGLSLSHTRRLLAGYRQEGVAALANGNRGLQPANKLDDTLVEAIVGLAQGNTLTTTIATLQRNCKAGTRSVFHARRFDGYDGLRDWAARVSDDTPPGAI